MNKHYGHWTYNNVIHFFILAIFSNNEGKKGQTLRAYNNNLWLSFTHFYSVLVIQAANCSSCYISWRDSRNTDCIQLPCFPSLNIRLNTPCKDGRLYENIFYLVSTKYLRNMKQMNSSILKFPYCYQKINVKLQTIKKNH